METVTLSSKYQLVLPRGAVLDKGGVIFLVPAGLCYRPALRGDARNWRR